jgi:putative oxidoreductase|tara:strand:+ start:80 stop:466 length:387 start_codon:yes stop_codon:yes gene_type:complete
MVNLFDLIARIFISSIFLFSGISKILNFENTIQWMESYGVNGILLYPAIILEILMPVLIIVGYHTKIAAFLLLLFSISTALIFHNDFSNQIQLIAFLKNISLAGGLLFLVINGTKDWSLETKKKYVRL